MHVFAHAGVQKVALQASVYVFSSPIGRMTGIKVKLSKYFQLFFFRITEEKLINPEKTRKLQILFLYLQFRVIHLKRSFIICETIN